MMERDFRELIDNTPEDMQWDSTFDEAPELTEAPRQNFLGMTPQQRFILSLMFLMMVCMLGTLCMLVTERMVLPF